MKRFGQQLHKKAQSIKLSAAERSDLRERIVAYMEYHPLPKEATKKRSTALPLISEPYKAISWQYVSSFAGVLTMIVLIVVPVVAERTVPGDVLYPVKVQFNEEVRSTLSLSPYAKVEWETKRLERRLAEARLLADEGKLTDEIEAEVAEAVQAHSEAAKQEIATIRESDTDEAAIAEIAFASALEVQSEVLANQEEQADEEGESVAALVDAVADEHTAVVAAQETANPSFEKLVARIEIETTNAQELFASITKSASTAEVNDIDRRFADIKRKVDEAIILHTETNDADDAEATADDRKQAAQALLKTALADTRKLISFMTDIEVRTTVSIEELVPVTPTEDEVRTRLETEMIELGALTEQLAAFVPEETMVEKFALGKEQFDTLVTAIENAQANDTLLEWDALVSEAVELGNDLLQLGEVVIEDTEGEESASSTEAIVEEESETDETATSSPTIEEVAKGTDEGAAVVEEETVEEENS